MTTQMRVAATAVALLLLAGCTAADDGQRSGNGPSPQVPTAPAHPPETTLVTADGEAPGELIFQDWVVDGERDGHERGIPDALAQRGASSGEPLTFHIDTDRAPWRVDVFGYPDGLDQEGIPTGEPELLACSPDGGSGPCTYDVREDEAVVSVSANLTEESRFVIVNVAWLAPGLPSPPDHEAAASWVFDIGWR